MGSFKGVKEVRQKRGGRRGGDGRVSQEKFNKTISCGGWGPRQSPGEALHLVSVLDTLPCPLNVATNI